MSVYTVKKSITPESVILHCEHMGHAWISVCNYTVYTWIKPELVLLQGERMDHV